MTMTKKNANEIKFICFCCDLFDVRSYFSPPIIVFDITFGQASQYRQDLAVSGSERDGHL